jgi:hypothetical protein
MDDHRVCVKCGETFTEPEAGAPDGAVTEPVARPVQRNLRYLRELAPRRERVAELLPHPVGWVLGIGIPVIACLAVLHAVFLGDTARAGVKKKSAEAAQKRSEFGRCVAQGRAATASECGVLPETDTVQRFACQVSRNAMEYGRCVGSMAGKFGRCLSRCGQAARSCSAGCAAAGVQGWSDTARCLMPCWREKVDECARGCF